MSAALDLSERDIERETVPAPVRPAATDAASAGSRSSRKEREDAAAGLRRIDIDIGVDVESGVRPGQVAHAYVEHAGPKRAYMRIGLTSAVRETLRAFKLEGDFLEEAVRRIAADDEALLPRDLIIVASVLCFSSLFAVGVVKGRATRSSQLRSGLENVVLGGLGAALCYGIGALAGSGAARAP
eukprot:tig00000123_g6904.t1